MMMNDFCSDVDSTFISRRSWNLLKPGQQLGTRRHVLLLHDDRDGTSVPEVHLVEEASHNRPIGMIAIMLFFFSDFCSILCVIFIETWLERYEKYMKNLNPLKWLGKK
jgi:hypothetical protein